MLALRCTPEQFEMLRRAARSQGRSMSAWVREAIAAMCHLMDLHPNGMNPPLPPREAKTASQGGDKSSSVGWNEAGEIVRCEFCYLVQYRTINSLCRRCGKPLSVEKGGKKTGKERRG
jgi:hypothetical protein